MEFAPVVMVSFPVGHLAQAAILRSSRYVPLLQAVQEPGLPSYPSLHTEIKINNLLNKNMKAWKCQFRQKIQTKIHWINVWIYVWSAISDIISH